MRDEMTGKRIKAKTMTKRQSIPYLEKVLNDTKGKKRRRALEIAIDTVRGRIDVPPVGKVAA